MGYHGVMTNITTHMKMSSDERWQQVMERDSAADGIFVFAVSSTGIYCRPSCPSRRPKRTNVEFFHIAEAAEHAGYRACLRCKPADLELPDTDQQMVQSVCRFMAEQDEKVPTLDELARHTGMSAHHLQRRFTALMGISPRVYGDELRRHRIRCLLKQGGDVTGALYQAGYGSSSRLYENAHSWLGMTPASYAKGGKGATLHYALMDCQLGRMIVAATRRGIAFLGFGDRDNDLIAELRHDFPQAQIQPDDGMMKDWLVSILANFDHQIPSSDLPLDVRGTAFQARVWQALRQIAPGQTMTYGAIAHALGKPGAARAVGRACATNPVSLIVPCHRAVGSTGALTGYRWGVARKKKLLEKEALNTPRHKPNS